MIDKVRDERTETAKKIIYSSMEESNKNMLEIMKRQRKSGDTERTDMSVQKMYLTLKVMDKDNTTQQKQKKIIESILKTTLRGGSGGRCGIEELDERDGGMAEVNRDKRIIDVGDGTCKGAADDVERSKVFEIGKIERKYENVEYVRVQREMQKLKQNERMGQQRGKLEEENCSEKCETTRIEM